MEKYIIVTLVFTVTVTLDSARAIVWTFFNINATKWKKKTDGNISLTAKLATYRRISISRIFKTNETLLCEIGGKR